jgi:MFS family permease
MATRHPKGLKPLFFTEMWERLGFYLIVGILYLYIIDTERGGLGMSNASAGEIYGTYLAFVYFTPFLGGMIADRYLGFRRSVFIGGILMAAGYFALGIRSMPTFYSGLVLLCLGNGLFKPNISAMVGNLYEPGDPRRDAGFNIFYMGINIGASASALLAAPLRNLWSFNLAFTAAGVGLLISVVVLMVNWKGLSKADPPRSAPAADDVGMKQIVMTILLPAAIFGAIGYFVGQYLPFVVNTIGPVTFAFLVGMLPIAAYFVLLVKRATPEEKPGLAALIPVYVAGGAFFMVLHLSGGLMTVFAEHDTDRQAEWIPKATDFYAQKAMPSYFSNAGPELSRPDPQTLVIVDADTESMFGARILTESVVQRYEDNPGLNVLVLDPSGFPEDERFLACGVYGNENVSLTTSKDAHGVTTTSVKLSPENTSPSRKVILGRYLGGRNVPVILVTQANFDSVYQLADDSTPTLAAGTYVRLVNAEMITWLRHAGRAGTGDLDRAQDFLRHGHHHDLDSDRGVWGVCGSGWRDQDLDDVAGDLLPGHYHRRTLPVADGSLAGDQAVAQASGRPDDGWLVRGDLCW